MRKELRKYKKTLLYCSGPKYNVNIWILMIQALALPPLGWNFA